MTLFHSKSIGLWQQFPFPQVISVLPLFLTKDKSSLKHSISVSGDGEQVSTSDAFNVCTFSTSLHLKSSRLLPLYGTASLRPYPGAQLDALSTQPFGRSGISLISNCPSVTGIENKANCFNASASKAV